ncbi:MAG TPA: hypothetical protein VNU70_00305 [Puia sp.]|jgi:hypothetical protein|nr:hypothetical protein [Puia sp.]
MQRILYICLFLAIYGSLSAQVVSGSWFGHADVQVAGMHNNYLTELVIKQKGTHVDGVFGYYFRDKYQSFFIHGTYDPKTHQIRILNIPVIYYGSNSTVNSIDCNTNFIGVVIQSKLGSTVKGTFYHDEKYKYMCPDLVVSYELDKTDNQKDSIEPGSLASSRIWKPQADDFVADVSKVGPPTEPVVQATPAFPPPPRPDTGLASASPDSNKVLHADSLNKAVAALPADSNNKNMGAAALPDSAKAIAAATPEPAKPDPVKRDIEKLEASFAKRKAVLNQVFDVESDSVRLSFYDNGEIDGDSISVFVNNQLVVSHQELAAKAFNIYLRLDSTRDINEISMFAENLGRIPPNTALMVVTDGKNRYEVFLSSSLTENATIQLRRKRNP